MTIYGTNSISKDMKSLFVKHLLETAVRNRDKAAIVDIGGRRSTTYGQLLDLAKKVAAYLHRQEVAPHSNVCIRMPDTMEFMAAELGVWLSRCAAVPVGMNFPEERVRVIEQNCESALLIDEDLMLKVKEISVSDAEEITLPETTDDALIIYTSGSTGVPKGILFTFEPFDAGYPHTSGLAAPSEEQVFGVAAPFYFIAIVFLYDMLRAGATVHLYDADVRADAEALADYILAQGITASYISPAVLLRFQNRSPKLKAVVTGSEKLSTQHSKDGYKLYSLFGLTETFCSVSSFEVGTEPSEHIPLGPFNSGIEFKIVGEEGELCLRGSFCKGYWREPELTQKLYADGWLHTGDIVSQGTDGNLYYRNRKDWMVKVNGQRVEPGEVEAAIRKMPEVEDVIVKGFDNGNGSQYLCTFYIAGREIGLEEFSAHLEKRLPRYMHPGVYAKIDSFPLNANGKVNRLALAAPERKAHQAKREEPETEREAILLDIARRVLRTEELGVTDNLKYFGMDSLSATQIANQAIDKGIVIRMRDLMIRNNIRELAN